MDGPDNSASPLAGLKIVSLLTLISRVTGLARDALMASLFGTGWVLDAFSVAFRIPNLFRRLFGEGAVTAALLPEFVAADQQLGRQAAATLFGAVARRLLGILTACVVLVEAGLVLTRLLGNLSERNQLLCELTILMLPYAVLICAAAIFSAGLNAVQHFVIPALVPIVLNLVWLFGGLLAAWWFATDLQEVRGIAVCILIGGAGQLWLAQVWAARYGIRFLSFTTTSVRTSAAVNGQLQQETVSGETRQRVRQVFQTMVPVLIGLSIMQINTLVDSALAWLLVPETSGLESRWLFVFRLPEGTASALYLGQRLFQFPMGVFGTALSTVLFPRFARHARDGDRQQFSRDVLHGLQLVLIVGIPASAGLVLMAQPITDLLFRHGQFTVADAVLTSRMIAAHGVGVWVFCGLMIVNRVFYAAGDQRTPMRQGLISVGLNLIFNIVLIPICGAAALPLGSVLATLLQLGLALEVLRRRRQVSFSRQELLPILWRSLAGTALMTVAVLAVLAGLSNVSSGTDSLSQRLLQVLLPIAAAVVAYQGLLSLTGVSSQQLLREPYQPRRSS